MSNERPRQFNDPFANVRPSASIASGAPTPVAGGAYTPSQPMTYEQKMKNEASMGSFLDMIGGGSQAPVPSRPRETGLQMKGSVASIAPSQISNNAPSIRPSQNANMMANLDDLEDLA